MRILPEGTSSLEFTSKSTQTEFTNDISPVLNHYFPTRKKSNLKIFKCRLRFKKRKCFRKLIESTFIQDLDDRPFAKVKIFDKNVIGLLDSGANVSVLGKNSLDFLKSINASYKMIKSIIRTASNTKQDVIGFCTLPVCFKGVKKDIDFYIVPSLHQEAYFGTNFWREFAIAPDIISPVSFNIAELSSDHRANENFHNLSPEEKLILEQTILQFPSYEKLGLGCTDILEHHIETGDAAPIKSRHYPLSPPRQEEAYQEIERLLSMGVIEESNSP